MKVNFTFAVLSFIFAFCLLPFALASAHEVYILSPEAIQHATDQQSPNPLEAFAGNEGRFFFWGFVAAVVTLTVFFASLFRAFAARTETLFAYLKRRAHLVVRFTVGTTLIVFSLTGALYGTELSFDAVFSGGAPFVRALMFALGACIVAGFQTRLAAAAALAIFAYAATSLGAYSITYLQHAGAYAFLILVGGGEWTVDHRYHLGWHARKQLERYSYLAFPLLRITLGLSIIFASFYAKFLHSNLALSVVSTYGLESFFPFDPLFTVLGAFIIEFLAGLMIVLGIELRWTVLFLVFWLTLAHLYFPEPWWVHLSLYGLGLAVFCHGYDRYSLEGYYLKRGGREPVF